MAKQIVTNYTFTPGAAGEGTITFTDFATIYLEKLYLITDVTNSTIIYQFNNSGLSGSTATNVLTLDVNTSGLSSGDQLMIIYEIGINDPVYEWTPVTLASALSEAFDSVLTYPRGYNYQTYTGSGLVLTGPGKLHGMFVATGSATVTMYDNTSGSGTTPIPAFTTTAATYYNFGDSRMANGIYLSISGTATLTIFYDPTTT